MRDTTQTHYTFGDVDLAADRLYHLARVFEPSMLDFLRRAEAGRGLRVLDLGCGPGYTTTALWKALSPQNLVGIDGSERFLVRARQEAPADIVFRLADVTTADFGDSPVDLAYSRFLLTHLPNPAAALSHWASAVATGGRILLQETADLASTHPDLRRYYELVAELQRRHGQSLNIGRELSGLVDPTHYRVVAYALAPVRVAAHEMARLHAMNIVNWRHDAAARDFDPTEIDRLTEALLVLSADTTSSVHIDYTMGEMVLERR